MKRLSTRSALVIASGLLLVFSSAPVFANYPPSDNDYRKKSYDRETAQLQKDRLANACQQANPVNRPECNKKLTDNKLRVCKLRERHINNIMDRMANRGARHIEVINKISERVQAFYVKKGKTVSNYDELVADVNAKKAAAESAVKELKSSSVSFKCDGSDPKGAASSFKEALRKEKAAIKDYKTAVRKLIVAVKSVQGVTSRTENKPPEGSQQ